MPTGKKVIDFEEAEDGGLVLWLNCGHEGFTNRKKPPKTQVCNVCAALHPGRPKSKLLPPDEVPKNSCNELLVVALRKLQEKFDNVNTLFVGDLVTCKILQIDGDEMKLKIIGKI